MYFKEIDLTNFRNYENLEISFDEGTNILFGDNAQGKTNILEAAYMSGTTKSHKGSRDREMIRFGEEEAHLKTVVVRGGREYQIDMHLKKNRAKGITIDKIPIKKAIELFGILNIVFTGRSEYYQEWSGGEAQIFRFRIVPAGSDLSGRPHKLQ